jgi:hypothetical protein
MRRPGPFGERGPSNSRRSSMLPSKLALERVSRPVLEPPSPHLRSLTFTLVKGPFARPGSLLGRLDSPESAATGARRKVRFRPSDMMCVIFCSDAHPDGAVSAANDTMKPLSFPLYTDDVRHVKRTHRPKSFSDLGNEDLLPDGAPCRRPSRYLET